MGMPLHNADANAKLDYIFAQISNNTSRGVVIIACSPFF
jgi:hypothetical protein